MSWWNPFSWFRASDEVKTYQPKPEIQKMIRVLSAFCDSIEQHHKYEDWNHAFAAVQGSFGSMIPMFSSIEEKYPSKDSPLEAMNAVLANIREGTYKKGFRTAEKAMEEIKKAINISIIPKQQNYLRDLP